LQTAWRRPYRPAEPLTRHVIRTRESRGGYSSQSGCPSGCTRLSALHTQVSLTGPEVGAGSVRAALELMCGYPGVRNLGCWGCSVGSDGLAAIAAFLILTGGKRWQGSRLRLLEVVADGSGTSLEAWWVWVIGKCADLVEHTVPCQLPSAHTHTHTHARTRTHTRILTGLPHAWRT
jgi:hypothetical protein